MPSIDFHSGRGFSFVLLCVRPAVVRMSAQETSPHGLIGYEGWDSLIGWQLPPNRMLPGGRGRREREAEEEAGSIQETTTDCQGLGAKSKQHHLLKDPLRVKFEPRA